MITDAWPLFGFLAGTVVVTAGVEYARALIRGLA